MKFTPGPWEVKYNGDGIHEIRMGEAIINRSRYQSHMVIEYDHSLWREDGEQFKEAEANAQLISAAPDLYKACKHIINVFTGCKGLEMEEQFALDRIYRALLKAEGRVVS